MNTPEPRYTLENDEPNEPEPVKHCDDTLSPDCTDDGQYQVWDGHTLLNFCLACRRVWEARETHQRAS